jgi:hypothetical protein
MIIYKVSQKSLYTSRTFEHYIALFVTYFFRPLALRHANGELAKVN